MVTPEINEFVALARRYVAAIDQAEALGALGLLRVCADLLPRLYAAALALPPLFDADLVETEVVSPLARLGALLADKRNYYHEFFDPRVDDPPVMGSLADDLAGIYLDVVEPLAGFDRGQVAAAVWQWRFGWRHHWGDHLVDGMRLIHRLVAENEC